MAGREIEEQEPIREAAPDLSRIGDEAREEESGVEGGEAREEELGMEEGEARKEGKGEEEEH